MRSSPGAGRPPRSDNGSATALRPAAGTRLGDLNFMPLVRLTKPARGQYAMTASRDQRALPNEQMSACTCVQFRSVSLRSARCIAAAAAEVSTHATPARSRASDEHNSIASRDNSNGAPPEPRPASLKPVVWRAAPPNKRALPRRTSAPLQTGTRLYLSCSRRFHPFRRRTSSAAQIRSDCVCSHRRLHLSVPKCAIRRRTLYSHRAAFEQLSYLRRRAII